ncbi:hypothetical protein RD792_000441 [Penstemon davidsonii]|uniref:Uncharacterized protein n=1 Tax=Penstemon davidsonii TaxID=160366 RepID=A0ABR0DKN7_9LAMI|nr:hypothetical protein RD792_000441 [Penstemon davidsonii]
MELFIFCFMQACSLCYFFYPLDCVYTARTEECKGYNAHVLAGFTVGLPFAKRGGYDFGSTNITQSISQLGATILRHILTPPPEEAYSLHRKLSGAFLACIKLEAVVPCRELLLQVYENYKFAQDSIGEILSGTSI